MSAPMNREPDRNPRKALGKGLSALLPTRQNPVPAAEPEHPAPAQKATQQGVPEEFDSFESIPIEQIRPGDQQPRTAFDVDKLMELSQSIRMNGVIQPITVFREAPEKYRIIAGERRWKAASVAGLKTIPALVRSADQQTRLEIALIENLQREDLNAIEIATAFEELGAEHGLTHEQIAERTGKDRSTITNFLRLLRLSPYVRDQLIGGAISVGHARALLNITDDERQARTCEQIVENQLSVRSTEQLVKNLTTSSDRNESSKTKEPAKVDPNVQAALLEMSAALGTKVRLVAKSPKAGRLEIEYYSQDDLDRIYSVIVKQGE
jgi:ParB family chromosome partitioning protein